MFWLILLVITSVLTSIYIKRDKPEIAFALGISSALLIILNLILISSLGSYPSLVAQREKVISLYEEIETMRGAYYSQSDLQGGVLVGGSLDNIKQSTILSDYINQYANEKSDYNSQLANAKATKKLLVLKIFGDALYISEKVFELEPITNKK